jgi:hypothetical protein
VPLELVVAAAATPLAAFEVALPATLPDAGFAGAFIEPLALVAVAAACAKLGA